MKPNIKIIMTDGTQYEVRTTLADMAKWDRARMHNNWGEVDFNNGTGAVNLFSSYVAFACLVRLGHFKGKYEEFENLLDNIEQLENENDVTPL